MGKDVNAPKAPAGGGYAVYLAENRESIVKSLPAGSKMTDVAKKAGENWKALSETSKKPYVDKYEKKRAEYARAMEEYKKTKAEEQVPDAPQEEQSAPKKRVPDAPLEEKSAPKKRGRPKKEDAPASKGGA